MDRISALRNVEDALTAFERGEYDLARTEERVLTVLRAYATEFDDADLDSYRATGHPDVDGVVVAAPTEPDARDRVRDITGIDDDFDVTAL